MDPSDRRPRPAGWPALAIDVGAMVASGRLVGRAGSTAPGAVRATPTVASLRGGDDRDLVDAVLQQLFAVAASLQATAQRIGPGASADRLSDLVDDLDDAIGILRTAVFGDGPLSTGWLDHWRPAPVDERPPTP